VALFSIQFFSKSKFYKLKTHTKIKNHKRKNEKKVKKMMEEHCCKTGCQPMCKAGKLVLLGFIILANQLYFNYSWWIVLGMLLVLKGAFVAVTHGVCPCHKKEESCCKEAKIEAPVAQPAPEEKPKGKKH
jgi:hypothetical protein